MIDYKIIGLKIKAKRQSLKMSQETLAEQSNLNWRSISNLERGICEPKLSNIYSVCQALELSLDELVSYELIKKSANRNVLELELLEALSKTPDKKLKFLIELFSKFEDA